MREVAKLLRDLKQNIGIHPELLVGGTYYGPCVALVRALVEEGWFPKALAVASCAGDARMIDELGENVRWVIGPTQWDKRLAGVGQPKFLIHFFLIHLKPRNLIGYEAIGQYKLNLHHSTTSHISTTRLPVPLCFFFFLPRGSKPPSLARPTSDCVHRRCVRGRVSPERTLTPP